ncbi:multi antimicrobial extrusion protein MatE [Bacillus sp. EAC]|uniref:multi antimicrobial extrusion protein MatE n=1 Tax=Bacillus sp. EAC TaxID=1978338 RepID=UPI000B43301B|nr:multi antimicrobial extrusion protein MatE [Bacillus sp. EAC]
MSKIFKNSTFIRILIFFIPLAVSASLTSISHVIINGTLSRTDHAEVIIANYAIAFSLFGILERPVLVFRQTSSALANGKASFNKIATFFIKVSLVIAALCSLIGLTRFGDLVFKYGFNAEADSMASLKFTFLILSGVILFSGLRCLYQGLIINKLETKWVTIGVVIRLVGMFTVALYLNLSNHAKSSVAGAIIFLTGMAIECFISVWRGNSIVKENKKEIDTTLRQKEISAFYFPLVFYLSFQTILIPMIYAFLGNIHDVHLGIASFALAFSITNLILSFFMYTHQIVLQFYEKNKRTVLKCVMVFSIVPSVFLAILCFTSAGPWFMRTVLGADMELATESLNVLKFFIIKTLVFPWVDYYGGILMLQKNTKSLLKPQIFNMITVVLVIIPLVYLNPALNGRSGAIAASTGELIGLLGVYSVVNRSQKVTKVVEQKTI